MANIKKKDGKYFKRRGSNKIYSQLNDLDELKTLLREFCPADVARMKKVPYNSLRHIIVTEFTEDEQMSFNWARKRHFNRKKSG